MVFGDLTINGNYSDYDSLEEEKESITEKFESNPKKNEEGEYC